MNTRRINSGWLAIALVTIGFGCTTSRTEVNEVSMDTSADPRFSIMQGPSSSETLQLAVLVPRQNRYLFSLKLGGSRLRPATEERAFRQTSPWAVQRITFEKLRPSVRYRFEIRDAETREVLDWRWVKTQSKRPSGLVKIAIASCSDDNRMDGATKMWKQLLAHKPDLVFLIGDNVYTDNDTYTGAVGPTRVWDRHAETRRKLEIFKAKTLIPIHATWDDHDFGKNDGDRRYRYKEETREIFEIFFPQRPIIEALTRGPGVASKYTSHGIDFFFLDDRSFRSPRDLSYGQTHFGVEQENWLYSELEGTENAVWLISGDQFFGGYHEFESYEGNHPDSFRRFISRIRTVKTPIAFISGDRHLTELMKIPQSTMGYTTYEFTTSGIHAAVFPPRWDKAPNPRQIEGEGLTFNYGLVKARRVGGGMNLQVEAWGPDRALLYRRLLKIRK